MRSAPLPLVLLAFLAPERHDAGMHIAELDPHCAARIVARRSLLYRDGEDRALDRPAHVRAASGLAWIKGQLAAIQDDAHFIALIDPESGQAEAIPLPAGPGGKRLFDDTRGTKHLKLDLEACFAVSEGGHTQLIALGSGSKPLRERIVVVSFDGAAAADLRVIDAGAFYAGLHAATAFSGGELNLEGALSRGDSLLLFQRGNGAPRDGQRPANALAELSFAAFQRYLAAGGAPPPLARIARYDLGAMEGVPFTFTDATLSPAGEVVFLASAEDSGDSVSDGMVHGTRLGWLAADGQARMAPLCEPDGSISRAKAEGIAIDPRQPTRAFLAVDCDDPALPAELLEVQLTFSRAR